jgi:hypothetical protein
MNIRWSGVVAAWLQAAMDWRKPQDSAGLAGSLFVGALAGRALVRLFNDSIFAQPGRTKY